MNKFATLFKKEIRDTITLQTVIPIIVCVVMFMLLGTFFQNIFDTNPPEVNGDPTAIVPTEKNTVGVINLDQSPLAETLTSSITQSGFYIATPKSTNPSEALAELEKYTDAKVTEPLSVSSLLVIPKGFGEVLTSGQKGSAQIEVYNNVKSFSMMSMFSGQAMEGLLSSMSDSFSKSILEQNIDTSKVSLDFIRNPIETVGYTRANQTIEKIDASAVVGFVSSQTIFIPIIVFLLITFSMQTLASSVTGEKADKTLETLLTTPVSRSNILVAKMLSAGIISIVYAVVYMVGFRSYMGGMMGATSGMTPEISASLANLGVSFQWGTYVLIGISLFLSVMVGLSIAIVMGVLAEDIKKLQGLTMPVMLLLMIPYLISMFADINTLPMVLRILLYLIPFTHTFTATANLFTGNMPLLIGGMIYQLIFLLVSIGFATHIFGTDKIFTLKLEFGKKKKATPKE